MAKYTLSQTGAKVQEDLNKIESLEITYDASNKKTKIGATSKELAVSDDGDVNVARNLSVAGTSTLDGNLYAKGNVVIDSLDKLVNDDNEKIFEVNASEGTTQLNNLGINGATYKIDASAETKAIIDNAVSVNNAQNSRLDLVEDTNKGQDKRLDNIEYALQGTIITNVTDEGEAYQIDIPTSDKLAPDAMLNILGGKSSKWNQLITNGTFESLDGWSSTAFLASVSNNALVCTYSTEPTTSSQIRQTLATQHKANHSYLVHFNFLSSCNNSIRVNLFDNGASSGTTSGTFSVSANVLFDFNDIILVSTDGIDSRFLIYPNRSGTFTSSDNFKISNVFMIDLTAIFGSDVPTSTTDERIQTLIRIAKARPQYDAGSLIYTYPQSAEIALNAQEKTYSFSLTTGLRILFKLTGDNLSGVVLHAFNGTTSVLGLTAYEVANFMDSNGYVTFSNITFDSLVFGSYSGVRVLNILSPSSLGFLTSQLSGKIGDYDTEGTIVNVVADKLINTYSWQTESAKLWLGYGYDKDDCNLLNLVDKKSVINIFRYIFDGTETLKSGSDGRFYFVLPFQATGSTIKAMITDSDYADCANYAEMLNNDKSSYTNGTNLYIRDANISTASDLLTALKGKSFLLKLVTPIEIDLSTILGEDEEFIPVESGGTITFQNENKADVPYSVTYEYKNSTDSE